MKILIKNNQVYFKRPAQMTEKQRKKFLNFMIKEFDVVTIAKIRTIKKSSSEYDSVAIEKLGNWLDKHIPGGLDNIGKWVEKYLGSITLIGFILVTFLILKGSNII